MDRRRLINCSFLNASSFTRLRNTCKLAYIYFFLNADDKGFVNNADDIISLIDGDYGDIKILIDKHLIYEFRDNVGNCVYLIRHWFVHNKLIRGLWTNYGKYLRNVELVEGEYRKIKTIKEN